jgi:hypothetical protein
MIFSISNFKTRPMGGFFQSQANLEAGGVYTTFTTFTLLLFPSKRFLFLVVNLTVPWAAA